MQCGTHRGEARSGERESRQQQPPGWRERQACAHCFHPIYDLARLSCCAEPRLCVARSTRRAGQADPASRLAGVLFTPCSCLVSWGLRYRWSEERRKNHAETRAAGTRAKRGGKGRDVGASGLTDKWANVQHGSCCQAGKKPRGRGEHKNMFVTHTHAVVGVWRSANQKDGRPSSTGFSA